ncbi:MAG: TfoX/Sxy family DNA transformation protein [Proteobacteria bacterium]|nr:TfoX/Sxy family DNA transformation protein [Pseudomonadota bacterium]
MKEVKAGSDLQSVPSVGPSIEKDLISIGINSVKDLKGKNPELLYRRLCEINKKQIDRCVLYSFRCAVYFAGNPNPKPKLLKWWNWKDDSETAGIRFNEELTNRLRKGSRDAKRKKGKMIG